MKRYFYYYECESQERLFKYLDDQVEEGYIDYDVDHTEGIVIIKNVTISDDDDIYDIIIERYDLIEDEDYMDLNTDKDDYDDFYNEDDYES